MSESNITRPRTRQQNKLPVKPSPDVERLAKALTIDLNDCIPTGNNGEVTEQDVDVAHALMSDESRITSIPLLEEVISEIKQFESPSIDEEQLIPNYGIEMSNIRLSIDAKVDDLMACLQVSQALRGDETISLLDYIVKATAVALMQVPECNIQFCRAGASKLTPADIAIIRPLTKGQEVSIITAASSKTVEEISQKRQELSHHAKVIDIQQPARLNQCSIAVFDLGVQGIRQFEPAINSSMAVLGMGSAEPRAVVIGGGVGVATILTLSLSLSSQAIKEVNGAKFLSVLKQVIETPTAVSS